MISHINKITQDYEHAKTTKSISLKTHRILNLVKLETPLVGWVKLNTDEVRDKDGKTSCDGIIRGSVGEWLRGFSKYIGINSVYMAELLGCLGRFKDYSDNISYKHYHGSGFSTSG